MDTRNTLAENRLGRYTLPLIVAVLILLTLVSYRHITRNGFVFDDAFYLVQNRQHVQQGIGLDAVKWAFTAFYGANWQPLTWLSSMLDYRLYGPNPVGHHATNLMFHIANTILLLLVLRRMTGSVWKSAFVAAIFALHPLHVESVAWASERKDVLSAFFMLLALWAYVRYSEHPSLRRYLLVAGAFALGLMAKPMLVSLPILLLLLDYWPLRRLQSSHLEGEAPSEPRRTAQTELRPPGVRTRALRALVWEKAPLFALSLASCVITYLAQRSGEAVIQLVKFPVGLRVANALVAYYTYMLKTIFPMGLAAYYPYPRTGVPGLFLVIALLVMAAVSVLVIRQAKPRPYMVVGWLWYVVTLIPVIGLVQVGEQSMADRYMYIPLIGLSVMIAWGVPDLLKRPLNRPVTMGLAGISVLVVVVMALLTSAQVGYWQSDYTLFKRVVEVAPGSALAFSNYGLALAERGDYDQAIEQYRKAIDADPYYVQSYLNLGSALKQTGKSEEALLEYQKALEINPNYTDASVAAATIMAEQGHGDVAAREYAKALDANPDNASAHQKLGRVLAGQGKTDEAISHFERAIELDPALAAAHHGLALVLRMQGRTDEAADHLRQAIRLKPDFAEAHSDYGVYLAQQGKLDEAMSHFRDAVRYRPDFAEARCNLALGLASKGDTAGAIAEYERAIKADPSHVQAHGFLAVALYNAGRYADAWREVRIAERAGVKPPPDFLKALEEKNK